MNVAVIGANGQLGSDVVYALPNRVTCVTSLTHADIDVSSLESVRACLGGLSSDVLVNTAAMHHVEKCEQDPAAAYAVNAMGTRNLAIVTANWECHSFTSAPIMCLMAGRESRTSKRTRPARLTFMATPNWRRIFRRTRESRTLCAAYLGALREASMPSQGRTQLRGPDAEVSAGARQGAGRR